MHGLETRTGEVLSADKNQESGEASHGKGSIELADSIIPIRGLNFNLNKRELWNAIKLRYDWEITDTPKVCVRGHQFNVDHAMVCWRGGFIIQRHNELRDLETEMLSMVCNDVETEPVLQEITGETLYRAANRAPDARLHISARGFWERQNTAFFDVRVCPALMQVLTEIKVPRKWTGNTRMKKAPICKQSDGDGARHFHATCFYYHRRNGRGM